MSEFIELKDLIHLRGKLTHDNFIFRNLKRIEFKNEVSDELAYLDINKHNIENREFTIKKGNSEIVLKGNKNYDFEIIDLSKNENW
ncbi:MAG: hypothetical protein KDD16_11050, partial [Mangrovimonas sp.]|nr:hypothetical protein [Mangrovimonas sp.]